MGQVGEATQRCTAFGLSFDTEVELAELRRPTRATVLVRPDAAAPEPADVAIRLGEVPTALEGATATGVLFQAAPGELLVDVPGLARYLVRKGEEIVVEPAEGAAPDDVRRLLYGPPMGALLQQRGLLTLHASAIVNGDRAVLFVGPSSMGTSTIAASLVTQRIPLLSDDIVAFQPGADGRPLALPGYPWMHLWPDVLDRMGIAADPLPRLRGELEARVWRAPRSGARPLPVSHVFLLQPTNGERFAVQRVLGRSKVAILHRSTYRRQFLHPLGVHEAHHELCIALARTADVFVVSRPHEGLLIDQLRDVVVDVVKKHPRS